MKKYLLTLCFSLFLGFAVYAQNITISGTVNSDADGSPIVGASVRVKGNSKIGTSTNNQGAFSLQVPANSKTLLVSTVGFVAREFEITPGGNLKIVLKADNSALDEVVVTALGIKRKSDNLAYAQQGVKGSDLSSTRLSDVNTALAGKVSNVQIKTQSAAKLGSASSIRIRGANSASGYNNDPLYVVNGTPIDDINYINADDIDDIQVLKGPAASALYGQRAANGVIMVTTKSGAKNTSSINLVSTFSMDRVGNLPHYQNEYSGGSAGVGWQTYTWKAGDPTEWKALDGKKYHTYSDDASWGPKMDGSEYIPWYAWYPGSKYSFKTANLTPQPNNIRDFYNTGYNYQNNVSFAKGGDDYSVRFSYTNQTQTGLIPSSALNRNYISTQMSYDLNKYLKIGTDINYVNQKVNGDFSDTYGNNSSANFNQWFHRDVDMGILKELQGLRTPLGRLPSWNIQDGNGISADALYAGSAYWTNPYTYYNLITSENKQDRLYGSVYATLKLNSHFSITGTARRNQRNTNYESKLPQLFELSTQDLSSPLSYNAGASINTSGAIVASSRPLAASYRTYQVRQIESNYEFLANYDQKFNDFTVDIHGGGNVRQNDYNSIDAATKGGLVVPDLFAISNSKLSPLLAGAFRTTKIVRSLYANGSVNWKDMIILDASVRNDISSALPANNNSYTYPSAGLSYIFTNQVKKAIPAISFGKVRVSYAQVGSDLDPYQTTPLYNIGSNQFNGNVTTTTPDQAIDPNIKPQLSKSFETGLDLRFLNNRIGFSGTYYNEDVTNSIIPVTITGASGYSSKLINAGNLNRHGVELTLDGSPVKNSNFTYNVSLNLAFNRSKVVSLYPGITNLYVGGSDYSSTVGTAGYAPGVWSVAGGEWGQLRGRGIQKINGQNVINADGTYAYEDNVNFGSVLPKFTGGIVNNFTYKHFNLNFSIDFTKGGKYFSLSDFWGGFSGLYDYTAGLNDKGKPVRDPVADGGGVHVTGVDKTGAPVSMYVDAITYFDGNGNNKINENHIFDLTYVKLREVNLGYTFDTQKWGLTSKYIKSMNLSVFTRNPWLIYAANRNFDPSELTGQYGESGQMPPSRTFGVTLKLGL